MDKKTIFVKFMGFILLTASASAGLYMSQATATPPSSYVRKNQYQAPVVTENDVHATTSNLAEAIAQDKAKRETAAEKKTVGTVTKDTPKKK